MFSETLESLLGGTSLDEPSAQAFMTDVLAGNMAPERLAAALVALRAKGPSVNELVGFAKGMLHHAERIRPDGECFDNCGTGGATMKTFNVSTIAAFVIAADGVQVAKHGNRTITRPSGSADLLEQAGARLDLSPAQCQHVLDETGIAFLFAPTFHPAMRHAGPVRQALGIKTVFNLLGPLTNPANAPNQLLGVFGARWVEPLAKVLRELGSNHVLVVHAEDGLDEISIAAPTRVVELRDGGISEYEITPEQFGMERAGLEDLTVENAGDSLALIRRAMSRENSAAQNLVALNAGAALYAAGIARDHRAGVDMALDALASGLAAEKLKELADFCQALGTT